MGKLNNDYVVYDDASLIELRNALDQGGHESVLLVTGRGSFEKCGAADLLLQVLEGRRTRRVFNFDTNPNKKDVERLLAEIGGLQYSAILAVGGGSVIDMAKLIKCFKGVPEVLGAVLDGSRAADPSDTTLFAIPTTAGSGSEATHFAVVYDEGVKFSVAHPSLLPLKSWVLPTVLASVPHEVAGAAGMDAFCQAVESYWSIHSTEDSKKLAKEAIHLSWHNILPAVLKKELFAIEQMAKAAHLAGKAINLTKTTAAHALAYPLTTHFGVLHGHAVAMMLASVFQFNNDVSDADVLDVRGVEYVKKVLIEIAEIMGLNSVSGAAHAIGARMNELSMSFSLNQVGVKSEEERELLIENGFNPGRVNNNPRKLTEGGLRSILESMGN